jgi:hypothetical protein
MRLGDEEEGGRKQGVGVGGGLGGGGREEAGEEEGRYRGCRTFSTHGRVQDSSVGTWWCVVWVSGCLAEVAAMVLYAQLHLCGVFTSRWRSREFRGGAGRGKHTHL